MELQGVIILLTLILGSAIVSVPGTSHTPETSAPVSLRQDLGPTHYVTTFSLGGSCAGIDPWVLSPSNNSKTVWVGSLQLSQQSGQPTLSQVVNFTLDPNGGPPHCRVIQRLPGASIQSIVFDQRSNRIWFTFNDTLAYVDLRDGVYNIAFRDLGGVPAYIAIDSGDNIWVTLIDPNQNRIAEYNATTGVEFTSNVPTPNSIVQGVAVGPDGSVWFAEAIAKKLGRLTPCGGNSCAIQEFSPPPNTAIYAPTTVAVDPNGVVWFTDHGSNQFGGFDPLSQEWRVYPVGYCASTYCSDILPNAISLDSQGRIWFSEHISGRVATFNRTTGILSEYILPSNGDTPLSWWAWPGPNNLVWFTEWALSQMGFVNATTLVPLVIQTTGSSVTLRPGSSQTVLATINSQSLQSFTLGISPTTNTPLFSSSQPSALSPFVGSSTVPFTISAAWNTTVGPRYVSLTAYNPEVAISFHIMVNVVDGPLPYVTLAFAIVVALSVPILYLRGRAQRRRNLKRRR